MGLWWIRQAIIKTTNEQNKTIRVPSHVLDAIKKINKAIKDSGIKVQASIQGDKIRVTDKKRDTLQQVMAFLKEQQFGVPLQFNNFKD